MNKLYIVLGIVFCAIVGIGAGFLITHTHNSNTPQTTNNVNTTTTVTSTQTANSAGPLNACNLFTQADAVQSLGTGTTSYANIPNTSSGVFTVSTCTYSNTTNAESATILIRRASNGNETQGKSEYNAEKASLSGIQAVSGIGDDAYWNPSFKQLNILKGSDWIIINAGKLPNYDENLEEQVARIVVQKDS